MKFRSIIAAIASFIISAVALAGEPDSYQIRHEQMIYATVLVDVGNGSGSGVVLYSAQDDKGKWATYILTNNHVISDLVTISEEWDSAAGKKIKVERRKPLEVKWFVYNDYSRAIGNTGKRAEIVAWDANVDLALVKLSDEERGVSPTAALMPKELYPHLTDHVWAVGAGLGRPPFATAGYVSLEDEILDGKRFILMSAPIIWGNSGGALWRWSDKRERYEVVGITSRGTIAGWATVVQSMSFAIPHQTIYEFLAAKCYGPIVGDELGEKCAEIGKRKEPKKE